MPTFLPLQESRDRKGLPEAGNLPDTFVKLPSIDVSLGDNCMLGLHGLRTLKFTAKSRQKSLPIVASPSSSLKLRHRDGDTTIACNNAWISYMLNQLESLPPCQTGTQSRLLSLLHQAQIFPTIPSEKFEDWIGWMTGLQHVYYIVVVGIPSRTLDLNISRLQFPVTWRTPHRCMGIQKFTTNDYAYEPLPAQHIRLLTLLPGSFEDDIHLSLHPARIGSQPPSYHALSYAWGSIDLNHYVLIDLGSSQRDLPITRNLYVALQYLRHSESSRVMWVDAVCINQKDVEERNDQVSRMADIYKLAEKVVIWLGPAKDNSSLSMRSLEELASRFEVDWSSYKLTPATVQDTNTVWLDLRQPAPFSEAVYRAVSCFLGRPWFGRLWQEVLLAANPAQIVCGDETMSCLAFRNSVLCLQRRREAEHIEGFASHVFRAWQICSQQSDTGPRESRLGFLLERTKSAQCSDPRDRVFAILNLVPEHYRYGLQPDYRKSLFDIFWDVFVRDCLNSGDLSLLTHCGLTAEIITCFSVLPMGDATPRKQYSWLRTSIIFAQSFLSSLPEAQVNEVICRTLCTNLFSDRYDPMMGVYLDFLEAMNCFCKISDPRDEISSQCMTDSAVLKVVRRETRGRTLIVTDNGLYVGLAPDTCREGDCFVVFLGCPSPMVLRVTEDGKFLLLGECYVHGLMNGEALLGPLLDGWRQVFHYEEKTQREADVFYDGRRGTYQFEDPRLGDLPEGWSAMEHPLQYLSFVNEEQDLKTRFDPRMQPQHLRERGVELQRFLLI